MGGRRLIVSAVVAIAGLLLVAPTALATFHLNKIREVYPGGTASYVEMQMYSAGENLVGTHHLVAYNANGTVADEFSLPSNVANGANNSTFLIANTTGYAAAFPGKPAPDEADTNLSLSAAGGAVCWTDGSPPDCVAWGDFTGPLPVHVPTLVAGNPASPGGVTAGKALRRTIAPACPTFLEAGDDSDDSATDFSEVTPNPRDNASPVTEMACALPVATIDSKPGNPTNSTSASFKYHSTAAGASFECKLDLEAFASCEVAGIAYAGPLIEGSHTFQVRAKSLSGTGAPVSYAWRVDTTAPTATIDSHPVDPSPGKSAAFTFHSSETGSTFECSIAKGTEADTFSSCSSGQTYTNLSDGEYTFKVRATDAALNQGAPTPFAWTVDNFLADTTPPETTIVSKPLDPSPSSAASFTYVSNELGSTFECSLDAVAFTSCPAAGITYTGLANGSHSFQVRAIDPSSNIDPTPAGYSFEVEVEGPPIPTPAPIVPPPPSGRPETTISAKPPAKTHDRTPTFRFGSDEAGSTFQCQVDGKPFKPCRSPFTTKSLSFGRHTVKIRAVDSGLADPTPAKFSFKVVRR